METSWKKYTLQFKRPAGTSRGVLHTKDSYFLEIRNNGRTGLGECGLLRGLSADDRPDYEAKLNWLIANIDQPEAVLFGALEEFPSIQFGLEMALRDLQVEDHVLFPSAFIRGEDTQPINGLIWMGDTGFMKQQLREKIDQGFKVLKMKIGAIGWEEELAILKLIRQNYDPGMLELRVDANGAFTPAEARPVLEELAGLQVHSIEQPIEKGQWQEMADLCASSPVPIALDEELIGIFTQSKRRELISTIKPPFIILKPSFIGGWRGSEEWIAIAREFQCEWWVTSALESNVGLSAIAQWNYMQGNSIPSGLGTGSLYTNNFESPLVVKNGQLGYQPHKQWQVDLKGSS